MTDSYEEDKRIEIHFQHLPSDYSNKLLKMDPFAQKKYKTFIQEHLPSLETLRKEHPETDKQLFEKFLKQSSESDQVVCTQLCKHFIEQVTHTYSPSHLKTEDVFVAHVKNMQQVNDSETDVNNIFQSLACWGLARVKNTTNQFALRDFSLFLTKLQEASNYYKTFVKAEKSAVSK